MSFGPLEKLFKKTDIDVDTLIAKVRGAYSGLGGPLGAPVVVSTRSFDDAALSTRFDKLMLDLDRMNLMRIAASKIPYVLPLHSDFRFTSGFGIRHDPKGRGTGCTRASISPDRAARRSSPPPTGSWWRRGRKAAMATSCESGMNSVSRPSMPTRAEFGSRSDNRYRVACK